MAPALDRRHMLRQSGLGLGTLALAMMSGEKARSADPLSPKIPGDRPRAKRLIHLFMNGGPSHLDSFDPKPELARFAGKPLPGPVPTTERATGAAMPSPFTRQRW